MLLTLFANLLCRDVSKIYAFASDALKQKISESDGDNEKKE